MDIYSDYLLSSFGQVSAIGLSGLLEGSLSHDQVTRMLSSQANDSKRCQQFGKNFLSAETLSVKRFSTANVIPILLLGLVLSGLADGAIVLSQIQ